MHQEVLPMKIIRAKDYKDMSRKAANIISAQVILKRFLCEVGARHAGRVLGTLEVSNRCIHITHCSNLRFRS